MQLLQRAALLLSPLAMVVVEAEEFGEGAPRYWPKFGGNRNVQLLDGEWDYDFVDGWDSGFDSMSTSFSPADASLTKKTAVPSCSDVIAGGAPGYLGPRGVAMYKTSFDTLNARSGGALPVRLQFQSCSFYCRVFVNNKEVQPPLPEGTEGPGHRAGGYVAFWVDVPADMLKAGGANELFVLADNRFNHTTAPLHTGGDFWHYGGLTRSVELHTLADKGAVLWRAYVLPSGADPVDGTTSAPDSIDMTLALSSPIDGPVDFTVAFDDGKPTAMKGVATKGQVSLKKIAVPSPKLWSPEEPNLHTVTVTYSGGSVTERFGLRSFGVEKDSARITINGKVTKLVGWNHHTQWPVTAASPTDDQMDADIALLKKGNANYVRGAHYPHDPRMIDRFDEAGILFWSETLGPSVSSQNMNDWDFFMKFQLQQLEQMLDNAMNHASILTWGWFNEGPSNDPKNCPAYAANGDYARKRDPSRFTTWADDKDTGGACYAHATLVAFNNYPGWYNRQGDPEAPKVWSSLAAAVRGGTTKSGAGTIGKPMVISETGAAGIYEWSANKTDAKWTLKYQSEVISTCVDTAITCPNISGITLWHFYDFKVDNCGATWPCNHKPAQPGAGAGQENNTHCTYDHAPPATFADLKSQGPPNCTSIYVNGRPGGENHKGSLDFWRREKPAFSETAAKYKDAQLNDGYHVQGN